MLCCGECFGDRGLRQRIQELSFDQGQCSFCRSDDQALVSPDALAELFGPLIGVYVQDKAGKPLSDWLREDWSLFQNENLDEIHRSRLLAEILDDGEIVRRNFSPAEPDHNELQEPWRLLIAELTHQNRFFPKTDFAFRRLRDLFPHIIAHPSDRPEKWFRARIQKEGRSYTCDEMGAPPRRSASHGRANPAGIPYLYLGSEEQTAVAEVRPHPGEVVSVAEFVIEGDLNLIDLREPRALVSPFLIGDEYALSALRGGDIAFLEALGDGLTTPVLPTAAAIDYTESQYLCEFIKMRGFHGVVYKSSVGDGFNLALFDTAKANAQEEVREFEVKKVSVSMAAKESL